MSLKNINPTKTKSWKNLEPHFDLLKEVSMKSLFQKDKDRKEKFTLNFNDFIIDFSKNRITDKTLKYLFELAEESQLNDAIGKYFNGDKINKTENRAVLHTALRNQNVNPVLVDEKETASKSDAYKEEYQIKQLPKWDKLNWFNRWDPKGIEELKKKNLKYR